MAFASDCVGPAAEGVVAELKPGDVVVLENTRFHPEEEKNDLAFAKQLAMLGEDLRQRRLRLRPPRACLDRGRGPLPAGAWPGS